LQSCGSVTHRSLALLLHTLSATFFPFMKQSYFTGLLQPVGIPTGKHRLGGSALAGLLLLASAAHSQSLTVSSLTPTRNGLTAPVTTPVSVGFSQPLTNSAVTQSSLRVFGQQSGGLKTGAVSVSGNTLTLAPTTPFKPGETVFATVTKAAEGSGGTLATPLVYQFTAATAPAPGTFGVPASLPDGTVPVDNNPQSLATGDVDGDGDLDLLTANASGTVSVRLNNGAGVFTAPATGTVAVGANPTSIALGDIDGDGDLDLLTTSYNTTPAYRTTPANTKVSVRVNNGAGVFTVPAIVANGTVNISDYYLGAVSIVLGDVDGDGDLDLLTALNVYIDGRAPGSVVSVSLNDGTGSFKSGSFVDVGQSPARIVLGDVDGDGDLDLVTACGAPSPSNGILVTSTTVSIRLNNGAGTFTAPANGTVQVDSAPTSIDLGDIDGDGDLDLVSTGAYNTLGSLTSTIGVVSVRLNNGAGTFTAPANGTVQVDSAPTSVALGDVDGDGDLDLVTSNTFKANVRLNDGAGGFALPPIAANGTVAVDGSFSDLKLGDVDGDGDLDLLTSGYPMYSATRNGIVSVRLNQALGAPSLAPTVANISAPVKGSVSLLGTNLTGATSVTFNGVAAASFTVVSATTITATFPPNVSSGPVIVTTPNGTSNAYPFIVPVPTVSSLSVPMRGTVTLTGTNLQETTGVTFNGVLATSFTVISATQLIATLPPNVSSGPVVVTTPNGTSSPIQFTVPPTAPLVTGVQPNRNAIAAPRTTPISVSFSQSLINSAATQGSLRVFSQQAGGLKTGPVSVSGNTLTLTPTTPFQPGETVYATVTTALEGSSNTLAYPTVFQFTTAAAAATGTFTAPANGTIPLDGNYTSSVATGDIDGDGDLDLVSTNVYVNTVSVRLNNGAGVFTMPANGTVTLAGYAQTVALGDVDGDGDLDLLAGGSGIVSVRLNNGAGVFTVPTMSATAGTVSTESFSSILGLGDIDGDGDLDVFTAGSLLLNNGAGVFTAANGIGFKSVSSASAVLGDVDGDGDLDMLATGPNSTVSVQLNNGLGNFTVPAIAANGTVPVGNNPQKIVVGDVDGDGDLDLLTANNGDNTVSVRLNNGVGVFTIPSTTGTVPVGAAPYSLTLGDVDGDGDLDLLAANFNDNTVSVRLNNGVGVFTAPAVAASGTLPVGSYPNSVVAGDVDGDGDLDILTIDSQYQRSNTLSVRLNQNLAAPSVGPTLISISTPTGGSFNTVTLTGTNLTGATEVSFNGQVVSKYQFIGASATELTLILPATVTSGPVTVNTPIGFSNAIQFVAPPTLTALQPVRNALAAPRNTAVSVSFGQPLSNSFTTLSGLQVFSQQAGGRKIGPVTVSGSTLSLTPSTPFKPGETVYATVTKNVQSADGASLIVPQVFQFTAATAPASGIYTVASTASVGAGPSSPVLGDVDDDGDLDLLVATTSRTVSVRRNVNNGTYLGTQELPLDDVARQLVLGDVDGDRDLDLVAVLQNGSVRLLRNQGNGTFTLASFPATDSGQGIALGDVDADGDLDLVLTKPLLGLVNVFTNDGTGSFVGGSTSGIAQGISPTPVLGDADGDGDLDLYVTDYTNRQARIYVNIGGAFFGNGSTLVNSGGGGYVDALVVGDIDNDGDLDLLTASYTSSRISVRRNLYGAYSGSEEVDLQARGPLTLALGDVDGDGDLDLLTTNQNTSTIGVRLNDGTGSFSGNEEIPLSQQAPGGLALGDIDGDGDLDLVTPHAASNLVSVLLNQNQLRTPENPAGTVAGVDYQYYEGAFTQLPDFTWR
jgi:hypothetical protein